MFTLTTPLYFLVTVLGSLTAGRTWVLANGRSQRFVDNIDERVCSLGGKLHLSKDVTEVVVDEKTGHTTVLLFADGSRQAVDYVIAAGHLHMLQCK